MLLIYNFLTVVSTFILKFFALFNAKINTGIKGRKLWEQTLLEIPKEKKIFWFHCASLGEFDQGLPLMNLLKNKDTEVFIVVSFFSPSGFLNYNKRVHPVDYALYLPFDTKKNAAKFLSILNPVAGIFVKYEFWPNFLNEAAKINVPIFSISTLLRPNQIYFKWYGALFRKALKNVRFFFVQNETTAILLDRLGLGNYEIIGDTRFDRVIENKSIFEASKELKSTTEKERFETFLNGNKAIIFGSSWAPEEEILISFLKKNSNQKIILAPHNVSESNISVIQQKLDSKAIRFTKFDGNYHGQQVLILDTIGQLATAYSYGKIAFVGGGFSGKLHNILEPAIFGLPVLFGPKHSKFPEADSFLKNGIGFEVKNNKELEKVLNDLEGDLHHFSQKTIQFVESQKGAAIKILNSYNFKY
jgi:3-deoxy-D-manno-octulosonic-acid transferase